MEEERIKNKITEKILEPSIIYTDSTFLLKIKVDFIESYNLITEDNSNLVTESEDNFITEGDYYE